MVTNGVQILSTKQQSNELQRFEPTYLCYWGRDNLVIRKSEDKPLKTTDWQTLKILDVKTEEIKIAYFWRLKKGNWARWLAIWILNCEDLALKWPIVMTIPGTIPVIAYLPWYCFVIKHGENQAWVCLLRSPGSLARPSLVIGTTHCDNNNNNNVKQNLLIPIPGLFGLILYSCRLWKINWSDRCLLLQNTFGCGILLTIASHQDTW